jgi:hypothetical protein
VNTHLRHVFARLGTALFAAPSGTTMAEASADNSFASVVSAMPRSPGCAPNCGLVPEGIQYAVAGEANVTLRGSPLPTRAGVETPTRKQARSVAVV